MQWLGFGIRSALFPGHRPIKRLDCAPSSLSRQITVSQPSGPNHPAVVYCPAVTTAQPMPRCEAVLLLPINNTVLCRLVQVGGPRRQPSVHPQPHGSDNSSAPAQAQAYSGPAQPRPRRYTIPCSPRRERRPNLDRHRSHHRRRKTHPHNRARATGPRDSA
jgi:hypothetical protein